MKIYIIIGCFIFAGVFMILHNNYNFIDENQNTKSKTSKVEEENSCTKKYVFAILLDTGSNHGMSDEIVETIGCNDQLIRVEIENCNADIEEMIRRVFEYKDEKAVYYNSLAMSEISIDQIIYDDKNIVVHLRGDLFTGGMCDAPRVMSQLQKTVLQFEGVDNATFYINGEKLSDFLSEKN